MKRGTSESPVEFDCTMGSFLLNFFQLSPFVLSSVEDSPIYLLRAPLGKECWLASGIKKLKNFPVGLGGIVPPASWVDLVPTNTAQLDLHGCGCQKEGNMVRSYLMTSKSFLVT